MLHRLLVLLVPVSWEMAGEAWGVALPLHQTSRLSSETTVEPQSFSSKGF